jgi:hypothetical protein
MLLELTLVGAILTQINPQQMACGDRASLVGQLKEKYHEESNGIGLTGNGAVMELFISEKGSWSLVLTMPNGRSCLISTGDGWETALKGKGKDI